MPDVQVKAGMVRSAEEYRWSSARFHLGLVANDVLVKDKNLLGLVENWKDIFEKMTRKPIAGFSKPSVQVGQLAVSSL